MLVLAALSGCNRSQAEAPRPRATAPATAPAVRAIPITTGRAEARAVQRAVETSGSLLAWEEVQARSEQAGMIARLRVDLGDRVSAGDVLAEYNRREFELAVEQARAAVQSADAQLRRMRDTRAALDADVARAQSQHEWAKSELERNQALFQRELIPLRDVDNARNNLNVAAAQLTAARVAAAQHPDSVRQAEAELRQRQAALGIAEKRLLDTTIRAPISGLIARRHLSAGEFIKDTTPVFTIVVSDPLKYAGTVPERFAPELRAGQTVTLSVDAYGARAFTGTVLRVAPAVEVGTRTLAIEARVPNADGALRPGFFAKGGVLTRRDPGAVFVPADALLYVAGISKVFVVVDGRARERPVRPGERQGTWVEIVEGVKPGETLATSNLPSLFDDAPVAVTVPAK
jgi:multidrug efflux pump subunit AcrA (membrane-fusion protein)